MIHRASQTNMIPWENHDTGSHAEHAITQGMHHVRLYRNPGGAGWKLDEGGRFSDIGASYYDPDFRVKAILVAGADNPVVGFDVPSPPDVAGRHQQPWAPYIMQPAWLSRVYLDRVTTATEIHLWG